MQVLLLNPDFYFTLLGLLESAALLSPSLLLFRFITVFLSIGYLILSLWAGIGNPGMKSIFGGACIDICLNLFMIGSFFYARSIYSLQPGWRNLYKEFFSSLLPFEFRRLLKLGGIVVLDKASPVVILRSGDPFQKLYFLYSGSAEVVVDQKSHASLHTGDWIAEFSMLTGRPASADVLGSSARLIAWDAIAVKRLKHSMPEIYEKVTALIARNLCDKLVRANRSANQVMAEQGNG